MLKPAPKDHRANSAYRRALLQRAATDDAFKEECWIRCSRDLVYFASAFCWTYSPKDYPECPDRPFVLYDYQESAAHRINDALGKHDVLLEKSRDMGASWLILLVFSWRWLFKRRQSFLIGSRKEDLVDAPGDPASLFWKIDYLLEHLPGWLVPSCKRTALHLHNQENGSTIDGESTNEDFARGDRRTGILLDEFAAVDNGHSILSAARGATKCRVFNSTPKGASGAYYEMRQRLDKEHPENVIRLHWSEHPERRVGLYGTEDNREGGKLVIHDQDYVFPSGYRFIQDGKLRSPWYDEECSRAASSQEIAQELDIDYAASGWPFFDRKVLDKLIEKYACRPFHTGELLSDPAVDKPDWIDQPGGRLRLWIHPDERGVIDPKRAFSLGCDISAGVGGSGSSNSVASVVDKLTGEKVAEFVSNQMSPPEFCDYVISMCRWFNDALLIWETNGPGAQFTVRLKEMKYRHVFMSEDETKFYKKKTKSPGFHSGKESKRMLLSAYGSALVTGTFINRSEPALIECGEYVREPNGTIVHQKSRHSLDPTESGDEHGDRVIADALAFRGLSDVARPDQKTDSEAPPRSFLGRRLEAQRKRELANSY